MRRFLSNCGGVLTVFFAIVFLSQPATGLPASLAALLRVSDVSGTSVLLLALAATLGQIFLAILSLVALRSLTPGLARMLSRPLIDGTIAAIVGGIAAYMTLVFEGGIAPLTTLMAVFTQGFIAGMVGLIASALALYLIENEEFSIVTKSLIKLLQNHNERSAVLLPSAEETKQP